VIGPWAGTAQYSAIVSLVALFAGLLGSLYADDIKAAFPFWWHRGQISTTATFFWLTAVLGTLMFFAAQQASENERTKSERRLEKRSIQLAQLVRTLPPADFLSTFRQIFWECSVALEGILDATETELNPSLVEGAVRVVLAGVAKLAQKFDGASSDVRYAANIMLFRPTGGLPDPEVDKIRAILRFAPPETDLRALRGVLILERGLSTTNKIGIPLEADPDLVPLALAVPKTDHDPQTNRWRVLPGAPMAFCTGSLEAYTDTNTLGEWCRREGDFPESTASAIDNYFKSQPAQRDRSFVSIALKPFDGEPIGVLNVHRDRVGLLKEKEPVQQFTPLVSPFVFMLISMVDVWRSLAP